MRTFLLIFVVGIIVLFLIRPKSSVGVPIELRARRELESLRQRAEDGIVLSKASGAVRRYFATAFELSAAEMTTTEFCRAAEGSEKIGPQLTASVIEFLRRCDELKFAPPSAPTKIGAAERGLELVNLGEARRALLRQSAAITAAKSSGQPA